MSQVNSLNVEMTLTIGQSMGGQSQSIEHLITSMCQFFETPWHNFKTKFSRQLNQSKIFKVHILEFREIVDEKNSCIKIPKPQIQTSWICQLAKILWEHLLLLFNKETHLIFYTLPKTNIREACNIVSSLAIFTQFYFASIKMLKRTTRATLVSTIH